MNFPTLLNLIFFLFACLKAADSVNVESSESCCQEQDVFDRFSSPLNPVEEALEIYRLKEPTFTSQEFNEIHKFILKMETAKPSDVFTDEDRELMEKMGFRHFLVLAFIPEVFDEPRGEDFQTKWESIFEPFPFGNQKIRFSVGLLQFFYGFRSIDLLSKEEYYHFLERINYFQGGTRFDFNARIYLLDRIFDDYENSSSKDKLNHQKNFDTSPIKKSELELLTSKAFFTAKTIIFDFDNFTCMNNDRLSFLMKVIFDFYTKQSSRNQSKGLLKVDLRGLGDPLSESLRKLLQSNSETLRSLTLQKFSWPLKETVVFNNLTEIDIDSNIIEDDLKFYRHSNYTKLSLPSFPNFEQNGSYFTFKYSFTYSHALASLVTENVNLKHLSINLLSFDSNSNSEFFTAVRSLKGLKTLRLRNLNVEILFQNDFQSYNSISELALQNTRFNNWGLLQNKLKNLKHFVFSQLYFGNFGPFLEFIRQSSLESISLGFYIDSRQNSSFFTLINEVKTLKAIKTYEYIANFTSPLDSRFEALFFQLWKHHWVKKRYEEYAFPSLPKADGVKFVCLYHAHKTENMILNPNHFLKLKENFPNLKILYLKNISVEGNPTEFDVQYVENESQISHFHSMANIFFGRFR